MNPNHPANNVKAKGKYLKGKKIWLGITGSVSCVETIGITRELLRYGADVTIVANRAALELVGEKALEFACGKPIIKEITGQVEHVIAGHEADLLIIAPCCATSLGKMVNGIGDNPPMLVALTCIGAKTPMIVAPAMDKNMAKSTIVQNNIKKVKKFANVIEPIMVEGKAKLPTKEQVVAEVCKKAGPQNLNRKKILIIGGGSSEPIDDVRVISNKSSGFMATSLSETAYAMGANVELWLGNAIHKPGEWIKTKRFATLSELKDMIKVTIYIQLIVNNDAEIEISTMRNIRFNAFSKMPLSVAPDFLAPSPNLATKLFSSSICAALGLNTIFLFLVSSSVIFASAIVLPVE